MNINNEKRKLMKLIYDTPGVIMRAKDFTIPLHTGNFSNIYYNIKRLSLTHDGASTLGDIIFKWYFMHRNHHFPEAQLFAGRELGAVPLITTALVHNPGMEGLIIRKTPRKYTEEGPTWFEGQYKPGMKALVLDDVLTSGDSLLNSVAHLRRAGIEPVACLVIVDREEEGKEAVEGLEEIPVYSIFLKQQIDHYSRRRENGEKI